jgi:hypothetical protein
MKRQVKSPWRTPVINFGIADLYHFEVDIFFLNLDFSQYLAIAVRTVASDIDNLVTNI